MLRPSSLLRPSHSWTHPRNTHAELYERAAVSPQAQYKGLRKISKYVPALIALVKTLTEKANHPTPRFAIHWRRRGDPGRARLSRTRQPTTSTGSYHFSCLACRKPGCMSPKSVRNYGRRAWPLHRVYPAYKAEANISAAQASGASLSASQPHGARQCHGTPPTDERKADLRPQRQERTNQLAAGAIQGQGEWQAQHGRARTARSSSARAVSR